MQDIFENTAVYDKNLIVFDGECVLCSGFFQFMLKRDQRHVFQFATAQSPLGQKLYRDLGLPTQDFPTNLVVVNGAVFQHLDAFAAAMRQLRGPWSLLSMCRFLPRLIKDPTYRLIARNRYAFFGRSETCLVPGPDIRARFAENGY
nr:DCC1-like thiol-disulfide oxidoreductase family protein [Ruegeria sp. HKCCSP351]